ncbi:MAG: M15 family metallopeptidase [Longimicrobiales bacterium]|nr:M15 family metallopeptidase [Longimicrobiales bacterium]
MRRFFLLLGLAACADEAPRTPSAEQPLPPPPASSSAALVGEYSDGADTLSVLERDGALWLLPWGGGESALTPTSDSTFSVPGPLEAVRVAAGAGGASSLVAGARTYARLTLGAEGGGTFRITPLRPPAELLSEALAAAPPAEEGDFLDADLVELVTLDPTIRLDVRYASTNNFMGEVFYSEARAFLQRPAAEALVRAHRWLGERGYGLLIHDGYRPWYVTKMFWEATPEPLRIFVADPAQGSRHNRGCAVDLTLYAQATGEPVEMPGGYDEMSPRSFPTYRGGTSRQRWHRELLRQAMEAQGFTVYEAEWWHFDYADWRRYRIGNLRFEELGTRAGA